jgi:hypothetical protein
VRQTAAARPLTWLLALVLLVAIGAGITHTGLLWSPRTFEDTRDLRRSTFAQTYHAARTVYAPGEFPARDVLVLGNSRVWLAARRSFTEPLLADRLAPAPVGLRNLAIFGAGLGDLEMLSRHLVRRPARLVLVTVGTSDLTGSAMAPLAGIPRDLLRQGWTPSPIGDESAGERIDRWGRTLWPLYGFRELARAALLDRVRPERGALPLPAHFASRLEVFELMYGERAERIDTAFHAWLARGTLEAFVAYLRETGGTNLDLVEQRASLHTALDADAPGPRALDMLLGRLAATQIPVRVLVMPVHPVLAQDVAGRYHNPVRDAQAFDLITRIAARHDVSVADGRRWLPADAFIDFDHPFPELGGFHRHLAEDVADALAS